MAKASTEVKKDTIYIDVDDEITMIIEKLQNSPQKIVALVLPKRASVLQSVVNMKLLKRTGDNAKKHIVLITTESGLLPLAGAVGVYVAPSLLSKPVIPAAPDTLDREHIIDETSGEEYDDFNAENAASQPIGTLAAASGMPASAIGLNEPGTIQLDNSDAAIPATGKSAAAGAAAGSASKPPKGKDKKLKIPNFNKFKLFLIIGALLFVLLTGGFIYANAVLPKAVVTLQTNTSDFETKANLTLDPKATALDLETDTLPAKIASKQQTGTQQVSTSGQKNNGTKSSGEVKFVNCDGGEDLVIPAGTGVSSGGSTFITQEAVNIPLESNTCKDTALTSDTVEVVAINPGEKYNIAETTFAVTGQGTAVKASSSEAFSGGTDNIVKVVAQADIDSAKAKISSADTSGVKDELARTLTSQGYVAIKSSLHAGDPTVTPSAAVGDQADTVSVTQATTYVMYGAKKEDIKKVITTNVRKQIDPTKQEILDDGYSKASYEIATVTAAGPLQVTMTATSLAGPDISTGKLATQLAGKKTGEVKSIVKTIPGVTDVTVEYSPFWVSSVPNKPDKVNVVIKKTGTSGASADGANR